MFDRKTRLNSTTKRSADAKTTTQEDHGTGPSLSIPDRIDLLLYYEANERTKALQCTRLESRDGTILPVRGSA